MTNLDQFESAFKAAVKDQFTLEPLRVRNVLVVTDLERNEAQQLADAARAFLRCIDAGDDSNWHVAAGEDFQTVGELLSLVDRHAPDLICAYRNLHSSAWKWPHSLGVHLDVLTQVAPAPVLVLPHPRLAADGEVLPQNTECVMAVTDHLSGDARLVNAAVALTTPGGSLWLTHVEDEATYERYIDAISKIPEIGTEAARQLIRQQLLKEPTDYVASCRRAIEEHNLPIQIQEIVTLGHHLADYQRLIDEHEANLLVLNTRDDEQLAMHGMAYSLAVEFRRTPLLML